MSDDKFALPIATLIETRSRKLGVPPIELVRRAGYKNISKGLRLSAMSSFLNVLIPSFNCAIGRASDWQSLRQLPRNSAAWPYSN